MDKDNSLGNKNGKRVQHWEIISVWLLLYDIIAINLSYFLALWLRFDLNYTEIPREYLLAFVKFIPVYTILAVFAFNKLRLYNSIWRFASYNEFLRVIIATIITFSIQMFGISMLFEVMPISYYFIGSMIQFLFILGIRFSYRFILLQKSIRDRHDDSCKVNTMLIGAGSAGRLILRDTFKSIKSTDKICCIIDDNKNKWNRFIDDVPIVGGKNEILYNVKKYDIKKIYLAIPSATPEEKREILSVCKETDCELKILPGIYQMVNGEITVGMMKKVNVEDLLGRDSIKVDLSKIFKNIEEKTILITGGGGSIGSELCRQIADHKPKRLIIFDIYENNAYDIQQELVKKYPDLDLVLLIGSVRDSERVLSVFEKYKPDIVYHAAAHKHVPIMEDSPCEAIKNNAMGTFKTACAAMIYGSEKFVLISTDKAVNPTNVMGASKRMCEMIIQSLDKVKTKGDISDVMDIFEDVSFGAETEGIIKKIKKMEVKPTTDFVAVRFGNVLGSNGSVIPLFKKQIEAGGPVTVTHPDIIRYFMTIPEAVSLVLQAGGFAKSGEIFVLDMGLPVKIDTLAKNLIKLSGYRLEDIDIVYTGLRPGEKLFEEKLMQEEGLKKTENELIHIGSPIPFNTKEFLEELHRIMILSNHNYDGIIGDIKKIVGTYNPTGKNAKAL